MAATTSAVASPHVDSPIVKIFAGSLLAGLATGNPGAWTMRRLVAAAVLACWLGSPAAATVVYEELTNLDDLPIDPPYPVLALGPGTSSVIGYTAINADAVDGFAFSVPAGHRLRAIVYAFTTSAVSRGGLSLTEAISGFLLVAGDGTAPLPGALLAAQNLDMLPGLCSPFLGPCGPASSSAVAVALFADALPLEAGLYALEQRALTVNDPAFVSWSSQYRIDLVVPEAEAGLLHGTSLAALTALARRRRRRTRAASAGATA